MSGDPGSSQDHYIHDNAVKEAKWRALVNDILDAIVIIGDDGLIQEVNPATEKLFGYLPDELVGQNVSILMPEPQSSKHDSYLLQYLATGEKRVIGKGREVIAKRKNGDNFPVYLSVSEARYDGVRLFIGVVRDLREIKEHEARLLQAQKYEAIAQLTAGIAHDFNNLLTVLQGNLEMLDTYVSDSDGQELLVEVLDAIEDGSHIIKQLLAFGRKQVLKPDVVNLNALVRDTIRLLNRTIGDAIEIKEELARKLPYVKVDPVQLENALMNLVINARDALEGSGGVRIKTELISATDIEAMFPDRKHDHSFISLSVKDSGPGMSQDTAMRAFEPFFSTKTPGEGSGLGLSMVQGFVKQSGGEAVITSAPGRGTRISLFLPCVEGRADAPADISQIVRGHAKGNGETILLVEDEPRVRQISARRLAVIGYRVLEAENGQQALEVLKEHPEIKLLLSDIIMPGGILGHELADQALCLKPDLKILLTTGYAEDYAAANIGSYRVLTKPYNTEQLAGILRETLESG